MTWNPCEIKWHFWLIFLCRKRAGELSKVKVADFENALEKKYGQDKEKIKHLSKYEQYLSTTHLLMKIKVI